MSSNINPYILKKENFFIENFFRDYYSVKWETSDTSIKTITYSFPNLKLKTTTDGETKDLTRTLSDTEKLLINNSIKAWDDAIDKIQFKFVNDDLDADITFGLTYIDGSGGTADIWSAGINSGLLIMRLLKLKQRISLQKTVCFKKLFTVLVMF